VLPGLQEGESVNTQLDWIGAEPWIQPGFVGPKRRRQSVHDEKEALRAMLRELTSKAPAWMASAGIESTREWVHRQKAAIKLMNSERASVHQLRSAISSLEAK
jgi:hypothetical protein